jgi:hypothetical protein
MEASMKTPDAVHGWFAFCAGGTGTGDSDTAVLPGEQREQAVEQGKQRR